MKTINTHPHHPLVISALLTAEIPYQIINGRIIVERKNLRYMGFTSTTIDLTSFSLSQIDDMVEDLPCNESTWDMNRN